MRLTKYLSVLLQNTRTANFKGVFNMDSLRQKSCICVFFLFCLSEQHPPANKADISDGAQYLLRVFALWNPWSRIALYFQNHSEECKWIIEF